MRILIINSVCGIRSTGRICTELADRFMSEGHEVRIAYGRETVPEEYKSIAVRIGNNRCLYLSALKARLFDNEGFNCIKETEEFLEWADKYNPDLLWLHNLHGYYLNVKLLFKWIKTRQYMQVKWTLHDCWPFTGHCTHFTIANCDAWKNKCSNCIQRNKYPKSMYSDNSFSNYQNKMQAFTGVSKLTIITPSNWLANLVRESFLKDYPIEVVYNTINTDIFKPTSSNFRQKYRLENKKIILGVASTWTAEKGLNDFIELSKLLDDKYKIVLIGTTPKIRKKLPKNILALDRTNSTWDLATIYSASDIFVNPSKEETFGLTTLEAISCGTHVVVYKDTACEEVINMYGKGIAVEHSVATLLKEIKRTTKKTV